MTTSTIKFLLVDDLESNLLALEGLLRREGLELLKAHSGPEALELLLVHEVALAVLDVQMPGMDGFELAELMRGTERTRRVPIIFLTAGAHDQQRRFRGYDAGAVDFIFKPIEPHILQSKAGIFFELARQRDGLIRSAEEARAASRAKDDFLAALSHELRTPLTPVLITATALEGDARLPADVREQLGMMRRNTELEARLIDDLLDITRISRGKLTIQPVVADVHQLLESTVEMVRSDGLGSEVAVTFELAAARHHVMADPARLHQVFWNLVKNALKFTPPGGAVTVTTHNDAEDHVLVKVQDSGIGIAAETLPHIFDAFEQGDVAGQHRYGGLGLGLSISKAIVAIHGGSIHAASGGTGRGATFTVSLATIDAQAARPVEAAPPVSRRVLRLLLVEDNEATRNALAKLLAGSGHQVVSAGTLHEALAAFDGGQFDVVVTDLGLPDGSGFDLMHKVRGRSGCQGIALSGYGMEQDLRQSKEAGFFAHLVKPVKFDQLRQLLERLPEE